jgi:YrbI family 3-deoxy-D-manno-octulosonate 8-phosphate phosphatase
MKVCAIIPARGGSKGIPGKNLQPLGGLPLVAHTVLAARGTEAIHRIIVSTDSPEIARVAKEFGAESVLRPPDISGDQASSEQALLHVLDALQKTEAYEPDLIVFLQCTSPLRTSNHITDALQAFAREGADSLFSASPLPGFLWRQVHGDLTSLSYDWKNRPRRQDAPEDLVENGAIYIFKPWVLRQSGNRLGGKIAVFRMGAGHLFQIDEPADLAIVDCLLKSAAVAADNLDWARIRLLAVDFDGVLTDDRVLVDGAGNESVLCHRGDGLAAQRLRQAGVEVAVISSERHPVVAARCAKIGVPCWQGCGDKLAVLRDLASQRGLNSQEVAFMGNDWNDLACLQWAGLPIVVGSAAPEIIRLGKYVTRTPGGFGALREVGEFICQSRVSHHPGSRK